MHILSLLYLLHPNFVSIPLHSQSFHLLSFLSFFSLFYFSIYLSFKKWLTSSYNNELFIRWRDIIQQNRFPERKQMFRSSACTRIKKSLRPNVESFIVDGEHTQQNLLDGPFRSIVTENVLVVSQVTGQRVVLHQLVLHLLPQPPPLPFPSATRPFVLHQIRIFASHPLSIPRQLT